MPVVKLKVQEQLPLVIKLELMVLQLVQRKDKAHASGLASYLQVESHQGVQKVIIKTTDDKTKRLALLAELKQSPLLDAAQRNAAANGFSLDVHRGDAFDVLAQLADAGERYDLVIVDPPAFIRRRKDQHQGEAAVHCRSYSPQTIQLIYSSPASSLRSVICEHQLGRPS